MTDSPNIGRCPRCGEPYTAYEIENIAPGMCEECFAAYVAGPDFVMPKTVLRIGVPQTAEEEIEVQDNAEAFEKKHPEKLAQLGLLLRLLRGA